MILPDNNTVNDTVNISMPNIAIPSTTLTPSVDVGGLIVGGVNLLWLPYVLLTLILLGLLVASFAHFHYKYRDRYIKRLRMARHESVIINNDSEDFGCHNGPYPSVPTDDLLSLASSEVAVTGSTTVNERPPSQGKRMRMLYGNKVDVDTVIGNSMFEHSDITTPRVSALDSVTSLRDEMDEDDYINESEYMT